MALEWLSGLFQSDNGQTRGLSGDRAHSVALDDANPYYNYRLKRHKAEGDLIGDPGLLWYTSPYVKRRSGLGTHVAAEIGDGTANYTDVLLILSADDYGRATPEWQATATRAIQQEFDNFCRRENFNKPYPHRPLGVKIVQDASVGTGNHDFQLVRGEFITGLLTNLYTGPVRGSYPVIGIHLNLPGVWEGYQEVGRLYNDQILFTLGNHWLDSFSHPSLQQAALYRLRQYPDGTFVHIVNPDLQDQYHVTSTVQGPASVLTLATRGGQPLAYMVLAVIDPPTDRPADRMGSAPVERPGDRRPPTQTRGTTPASPPPRTGDTPRSRPDIQMPKPPTGQGTGRTRADSVPSIAPPMMLEEVVRSGSGANGAIGLGGKTIIPDAPSERIFTLQERGALLQKVHFSAFMLGYDVYFGTRGELGTHVEDPAATFQVRKRSVSLVAHIDGVTIDGRPIAAGVEVPIEGDVKIEVAGHKLEYHDLRGLQLDGWPYVGEIRRPASSTYMIWGEDYLIGRSRECRVVLPDEPRNDNIHWKPSVGDGATIRARTGEIPKSRFYTDSIMVGSEHASVDLRTDHPKVVCTSKHCYAYIRRQTEVFSLYPTTSPQQPKELDLQPGDELLIGNCLFHVGYTAGDAIAPGPAPDIATNGSSAIAGQSLSGRSAPAIPDRSPDALADEVAAPDLRMLDRETPTPSRGRETAPSVSSTYAAEVEDDGAWTQEMDRTPPPPPARDESTDELSTASYRSGGSPVRAVSIPDEALDDVPNDVNGYDQDDWDPPGRSALSEHAAVPPHHRLSIDEEPDDPIVEPSDPGPGLPTDNRAPATNRDSTPTPADRATSESARPQLGQVVFIDDSDAQFEIGRPLHLVLAGWAVNGEVVCGNHTGADLILPENRIRKDQLLTPATYFRLRVRGRKGSLEILAPHEVEVDEGAPPATLEDPESHQLHVIRRDDSGERDFVVGLRLVEERRLPDPRARFLAIDTDEPLAAALVTRGLPKGAPRTLDLGGLRLTLHYDGSVIRVSDYLRTYRKADGSYHPFLVQRGDSAFRTAPEDGSTFELQPGDRMVIGRCVYALRRE